MSNPNALKLYREFIRLIKKTCTKNTYATMINEIRHHFKGNALENCETTNDIALGYRIIKNIKKRQ
jgi:hypothetical protein